MTLDELLLEWSYRSEKGYPSLDSPSDISTLKQILQELNLPVKEIMDSLIEKRGDEDGNDQIDGLEGPSITLPGKPKFQSTSTDSNDQFTSDTDVSYTPTFTVSVQDIIDLLPSIKNDQEALLKMKK